MNMEAKNIKKNQPKRPPLVGHTHGKVERFNFAKNSLGQIPKAIFFGGV